MQNNTKRPELQTFRPWFTSSSYFKCKRYDFHCGISKMDTASLDIWSRAPLSTQIFCIFEKIVGKYFATTLPMIMAYSPTYHSMFTKNHGDRLCSVCFDLISIDTVKSQKQLHIVSRLQRLAVMKKFLFRSNVNNQKV